MSIIDAIPSSRLICGDDTHAFRDPAVIYRDGVFHLYCTYVETEGTGIFICTPSTPAPPI